MVVAGWGLLVCNERSSNPAPTRSPATRHGGHRGPIWIGDLLLNAILQGTSKLTPIAVLICWCLDAGTAKLIDFLKFSFDAP
jgi:hypothetical protein